MATAPAAFQQADTAIAMTGTPRLALDPSQTTFCDPSGLNALIRVWKRVRPAGGEPVLLRPHRGVATVLQRTGLNHMLPIHDALPD
ncbi:hypothetical protein amrb99_51640 [Actinomadura sp. RB99]|uniref:STAS domain-containing protein n=1 Tax=Actinomadura sp. RB99 TaxID=2691577 RepID=UPI001688CDEC|nr:STAS domain-containing protein [Actinomadura sp. RB99]MBD2896220.1 hypothetical protein [Actinomadura sp. RB99]